MSSNSPPSSSRPLLKKILDTKIEWPESSNSYFIPVDSLEKIVTEANVDLELRRIFRGTDRKIDTFRYASIVCSNDKKAKKVFVILLATNDLERFLGEFLDEGITDEDLPFVRHPKTRPSQPSKRRSFILCRANHENCDALDHSTCGINSMAGWATSDIQELCRQQWLVQACVFLKEAGKIPQLDIGPGVLLPFTEDRENEVVKSGGFSEVWAVKIHPAHQDVYKPPNSKDDEPLLAVKRLFSRDSKDFQDEFNMLNALNDGHHKHLVKLLATYKKAGRYHFIFPFADANLRDFWKSISLPYWNEETYLWVIDQMTGLAEGLRVIHNFRTLKSQAFDTGNAGLRKLRDSAPKAQLSVLKGEEMYGRHGDLKPENILWLKDGSSGPNGILQITDLGLGRFHRLGSRSKDDPNHLKGCSATYTPPEIALATPVSRAYDVWSLGCIFIEFITWLLEGAPAVNEFANARDEMAPDGIEDDTFFTLIQSKFMPKDARVRRGVIDWIERLKKSERCSGMATDLLDLIAQRMMKIESKVRIDSFELHSELERIMAKGKKDSVYLLGKKHVPHDQGNGFRAPQRVVTQVQIAANNPTIQIDDSALA